MKKFDKSLLNVKRNEEGKVIAFDISRSYWGNGNNEQYGELLNEDNYMCCLGFYSLACGASENAIKEKSYPAEVKSTKKFSKEVEWLDTKRLDVKLAATNDAETGKYKKQEVKEERITKIFAENGIKVKFVK